MRLRKNCGPRKELVDRLVLEIGRIHTRLVQRKQSALFRILISVYDIASAPLCIMQAL